MTVGYLADSFDLINVRDLDLIAQAANRCSRLVAGVYSDEYVEQLLGRPPVVPLVERKILVSHVRGVTDVVTHTGEHPRQDDIDVYFGATDRPAAPADSTVLLTPRRHTESVMLREALRPEREAVA